MENFDLDDHKYLAVIPRKIKTFSSLNRSNNRTKSLLTLAVDATVHKILKIIYYLKQ